MRISIITFYVYLLFLIFFTSMTSADQRMEEEEEYSQTKHPKPLRPLASVLIDSNDKSKQVVSVFHSVEVVDISRVSLETMDFRVDLHMKQRWVQDEYKFPTGIFSANASNESYITVNTNTNEELVKNLWTPDAYIPNARITQIASLSESHSSLFLYKNRTIIFTARLYVILGCQMQFRWYPMDVQHCQLNLESYSYSDSIVVFLWNKWNTPVIMSDDIKLLRYAIRTPLTYNEGIVNRFGRNDKFSTLTVHFIFERQIGQQLIQVFAPTFLIVALSWFSFWLGLDVVPGRVSLVVTCMLTLVTMYSGLKGDLPPVAYIKMLDIWMAGCMGFVFAAMSEFIIVKYLSWSFENKIEKDEQEFQKFNEIWIENMQYYKPKPSQPNAVHMYPSRPSIGNLPDNRVWNIHGNNAESGENNYQSQNTKKWAFDPMVKENGQLPINFVQDQQSKKERPKWEQIDRASRVAFPIMFMIYLVIFWPVLIFGSSSQE